MALLRFAALVAAVDAYSATTSTIAASRAQDVKSKFAPLPYRGVNIGGWLVLESWIRPSLFNNYSVPGGVGEWQFCEQLGQEQAAEVLRAPGGHWDTWLTYNDLSTLATSGVTHIRIPIGYWILGNLTADEPFVLGGWAYLERALGWAAQVGIRAIIDLHGAPGSQNGHDNSGNTQAPGTGHINWNTDANKARTTAYLVSLAQNLTVLNAQPATLNVVDSIELLNEPWTTSIGGPIPMDDLKSWYQSTVDVMVGQGGWKGGFWLSDGWSLSWSGWQGFLQPPQYTGIFFDTHMYHCFGGPYADLTNWGQVGYTCAIDGPALRNYTSTVGQIPIVVGEYSLAIPDASTPPTPWTVDDVAYFRSFFNAQQHAYGSMGNNNGAVVAGSMFWCHKLETGEEPWHYLKGIAQGYIPSSLALTNASNTAFDCDRTVWP